MSDFEYSDLSSCDDDDEIVTSICKPKHHPNNNKTKMNKELRLHYSNLFHDTFKLIDLFVKGKILTYSAFLEHFTTTKFHRIYTNNQDIHRSGVTPHHYITITEDALGVASKFLRSRSRNARIGAVYLLFTLYQTQPLKHYIINVKMEPKDYQNTKDMVDKCLSENIVYPSYCFYELEMKQCISITADAINPCLEANYPRAEIRKHLGRVADKHFATVYEKRKDFDPSNKLRLMEDQMRKELTCINKLSKLTLGQDAVKEYKPELSKALVEINKPKIVNVPDHQEDEEIISLSKERYKINKKLASRNKTEDVLDDMVIIAKPSEPTIQCHPTKKLKMSKKIEKKSNYTPPVKDRLLLAELSDVFDDSESSISSTENEYLNNQVILPSHEEDDDNEIKSYYMSPVKDEPLLAELSDVFDSESSISSTENEYLNNQVILPSHEEDDDNGK